MKPLDVVVIGGGMVGLSAALMAARQGLQVALVEAHLPKPWRQESPDLRVVALALDNQTLIESFGLWPEVLARRAYPYGAMTVFDA
ncbi:FAD-dependent oxidoreductase, partial [Arenimonas sp. GDDSR-1]